MPRPERITSATATPCLCGSAHGRLTRESWRAQKGKREHLGHRKMAVATAHKEQTGRLAQWREGISRLVRRSGSFFGGLALSAFALFVLVALVTYHPSDPSLNTDAAGPVHNWMGSPGAWTSDVLLMLLGPPAGLLLPVLLVVGLRLARGVLPGPWLRALLVTSLGASASPRSRSAIPTSCPARPADAAAAAGQRRARQGSLERNARLLESVLEDFSVKGEIVEVRPGPVVTMYELEPASGIKASRVIQLADDIARNMSALSARVATIPGRSVIGIELPNPKREMVVLSELIASHAFEDQVASCRSSSARTSPAIRSSPTSRRCRICSSPAPPARASRSASTA
jgi:hypothetical protein